MRIKLISLGKNMPDWIKTGMFEYIGRLPKSIEFKLVEINLSSSKKRDPSLLKEESQKLIKTLDRSEYIIALTPTGLEKTSLQFAKEINNWQINNKNVTFIVGGPEGLSSDCLDKSDQCWSLSKLTFPHMLVRVIFAEQIYRAYCHNTNHPYAK